MTTSLVDSRIRSQGLLAAIQGLLKRALSAEPGLGCGLWLATGPGGNVSIPIKQHLISPWVKRTC